ncbi:hypothetical protein CBF34_02990 [Vagococcus penaei]|uniref:Uncharacterized protein n=1 Tax=Vagococcus penaei TaxID=633807 RepID=A0A1Q2D413_9ENTE|nr:YwbE family protein [Vagococcus penaei]AQP53045.1 hypothetical protein BW732_01595 [Vagococcus penaei]RSU06092.1 hypothetical protein CBF34_02990 [Vagococcus penaei]
MDGKTRSNLKVGQLVDIVLKKDQRTGNLTRGHIKKILTNSANHPHGIKVMLDEQNQVGRVKQIISN